MFSQLFKFMLIVITDGFQGQVKRLVGAWMRRMNSSVFSHLLHRNRGLFPIKLGTLLLLFASQPFVLQPAAAALTQDVNGQPQSAEAVTSRLKQNEHVALAAANDAIQLKLAAQKRIPSNKLKIEAVALIRQSDEKNTLVFRHTADWVEWSESRKLLGPEVDLISNAKQLAEKINLDHVGVAVMSHDDADKKLKECNPALVVAVPKLNPPFFNNSTNVKWSERDSAPILHSVATLDWDANKCIRADINLRDGNLICREVGCYSR